MVADEGEVDRTADEEGLERGGDSFDVIIVQPSVALASPTVAFSVSFVRTPFPLARTPRSLPNSEICVNQLSSSRSRDKGSEED